MQGICIFKLIMDALSINITAAGKMHILIRAPDKREGIEDTSKIIFLISQQKHTL